MICLANMLNELVDEMIRRGYDPETIVFSMDKPLDGSTKALDLLRALRPCIYSHASAPRGRLSRRNRASILNSVSRAASRRQTSAIRRDGQGDAKGRISMSRGGRGARHRERGQQGDADPACDHFPQSVQRCGGEAFALPFTRARMVADGQRLFPEAVAFLQQQHMLAVKVQLVTWLRVASR